VLRATLRRLRWGLLPAVALVASGCSNNIVERAGWPSPVTDKGARTLGFWQGSMIAALAVGAFVTALILWACIRFRRRSADELPRQVRYNLPIEVLYTAVPLVIVSVLFYFTAIRENDIDNLSVKPQLRIGIVGYQWAWRFNYLNDGLTVNGAINKPPTLVVPTGEEIQFYEDSPDVIHSWWVVPFLFKRDDIPGRTNTFELKVTKTGLFQGECAEYCGINHDRMLFQVRAMDPADYAQWLTKAKAAAAANDAPAAAAATGNEQYTRYTGPTTPDYQSVENIS
jgi:cytochrome c oxidase subunit 2